MKFYILATPDYMSFAEKLVEDIKNAKIITHTFIGISNKEYLKCMMEVADVILVIIDDKFSSNKFLNLELQLAQEVVQRNEHKMLFPIVLNKAVVPEEIQNMLYISCDSKSNKDIENTKMTIERTLMCWNSNIRSVEINRDKTKTLPMIILTLAIEMFAMFMVILLFKYQSSDMIDMDNYTSLLVTFVTVVVSIMTLVTSYVSIMRRKWKDDDEKEIASYSNRLKKAIVPENINDIEKEDNDKRENKNEIDALGRMLINLEDIKEFYTWNQKQAKASFILAIAICIVGFALMITAVVLSIIFGFNFQIAVIPAIGGIITELIAGTALVVYRNSLSQLNHYHKALHEDERFLSSVNLLGKFSSAQVRDDMLREIIKSEIQMNLDGLKEIEKTESIVLSKKDN